MFEVLYGQILNTSWLEWSAIGMTAICIFLAGRNNIHTWWTGMVACALYMVLFYEYKLYADVVLQMFFIGTSIIGWVGWKTSTGVVAASSMRLAPSARSTAMFVAVGALAYAGYTSMLYHFTDAAAPFMDSAVLVLSIIAQLWMMRRYVISWPMWIAVNTIAVPLFYSRELVMTSIVYAIFWVHAWYGWYNWYQVYKAQRTTA